MVWNSKCFEYYVMWLSLTNLYWIGLFHFKNTLLLRNKLKIWHLASTIPPCQSLDVIKKIIIPVFPPAYRGLQVGWGTRVWVDNHNLYIIEFLDYGDVWCCGQCMSNFQFCCSPSTYLQTSVLKACQPCKPSAQTFLWCGKGKSPKASMWLQATSKPCPPIIPWIIHGEHWISIWTNTPRLP